MTTNNAHANPVRYTDPSGYFSMGEISATLSLISSLAAIGGAGAGAGYVLGATLTGASAEEVAGMFGQWAAGYADGVSGGISTDVVSLATGEPVQPNNEFLWRMGQISGVGSLMLAGLSVPVVYTAKVGQVGYLATWQVATSGYGAGKGTVGLADGKWEQNDVWNLLSLLPIAGASLSTVKGLGSAKASNAVQAGGGAAEGVDVRIKQLGQSSTKTTYNCFVAGTEILTTEGEKNIEDIQVGDWVIADDPTTPGEIEARQVLDTFARETDALVDLYVDGEVISTTGEHPFWTPDKGWVEAKDLQVGSLLQPEDSRIIDVDKVEKREGQFEVYNFKVEGFHPYFVSDLGLLVHNANYSGGPTDDMWDELYNFRDPVQEATEHIMRAHPERLGNLGVNGPEALQNLLDDLYNNPTQTWSRPDGATAYVDPRKGIFIDNPNQPTIIPPRDDYADYLGRDGFTPD